jgi:ABC-type nitrate/sulfonate/bicarbonate transport system permease component
MVLYACLVGVLLWFFYAWEVSFARECKIVIYFGRPRDVLNYVLSSWPDLCKESLRCFLTATASLVLAGVMAVLLLVLALSFNGGLRVIERLASTSQTIPFLVIVLLFLLTEKPLFKALRFIPPADVYCLLPVTLALVFPPLANGAEATAQMPIQLKALSRIWNAPTGWRIWRIYLPCAINDILTGVRTSATWAIGATLITEGLLNGVVGDSATLGHALFRPFSSSAPPGQTPAVIFIATILGFAVYYLFVVLQRCVDYRLRGVTAGKEHDYPL